MDDRQKKIEEVTNYIINNITMVEVVNIVASRAKEVAEEIIDNNLSPDEYKQIKHKKKDTFWDTVQHRVHKGFTTKNSDHKKK